MHPFASNHYRRPLHPDEKTDDNDLEAIFHAAIKGYGLATLPVGEVYQSLQAVSRHRHNLIKQRARLKVQIRRLLHQTMPGYADLFDDDKLYDKSIAMPIALQFSSAEAVRDAGIVGIAKHLNETKVRFQTRTIERVVAWAGTAAEPSELATMYTRQVATASGGVAVAESARRKSMMLCQRLERRMRQCGAFELRISTRVARPNRL